MKTYMATFAGSYLGGIAIIQAGDEQHALDTLRAFDQFKALPAEQQEDIGLVEVNNNRVLYFWDGDY